MTTRTSVASPPVLIQSERELDAACRRWSREEALGLDTEFVRTRTFFPRLGLVQVADGKANSLVDVVAVPELSPLSALLENPRILKVLHSGSEDLEVFLHLFGFLLRPLFDTQIGASLAGHGHSLGYQRLVKLLFDEELPKEETRSNWLKRPLTAAQVDYAARDAAYLLPMYTRLRQELRERGRKDWAREEVERLEETCRSKLDPERAYLRVKKAERLKPRELAVLKALCIWREYQARKRDLPRNFVVRETVLVEMAKKQPRRPRDLAAIKDLHPRERKRSGGELLSIIREARKLPEDQLPLALSGPSPGRRYEPLVDSLKEIVARRAEELELAPEFLAQRRALERLVKNVKREGIDALPAELTGWRAQVIGQELLEIARRAP